MFCDLVGSTALSTRIDPEDMQELLRAYQSQVRDMVCGYGGFVAQFWATASLSTLAIRRLTKMMPSVRQGRPSGS